MIYLKDIIIEIKNLEELDPEIFIKDIFEENKKIHDENGNNEFIRKSMPFYKNRYFTVISKMKSAKTHILLQLFNDNDKVEGNNCAKFNNYRLYNFGTHNIHPNFPFVIERIN